MGVVRKTRQKVRRGVLIASLALFPVTFYWLSPAVPLQGAAEGVPGRRATCHTICWVAPFMIAGRCTDACPRHAIRFTFSNGSSVMNHGWTSSMVEMTVTGFARNLTTIFARIIPGSAHLTAIEAMGAIADTCSRIDVERGRFPSVA